MANLQNISPELIQKYQQEIATNSSPATAKRKEVSLNRFFDWAKDQGHVSQNPFSPEPTQDNKSNQNSFVIQKPKKNKVSLKTWTAVGFSAALAILIFLLLSKVKLPIPFTITPAQESQNQTISNALPTASPSGIPANSAGNQAWNLFAKLKLTDSAGSPRVGAQTLSFKVYNSAEGGDPLYTSDPQTISTDSNGSALISLDKVPADLFFQNNQLFLEPEVGTNGASSSRIPIETANTAANLGGYFPANPEAGAGAETVPVLDSTGALLLASQSPAVKATNGNLLIEGQTVTVKAADGSGGNIEINPDANGYAHFLFEGSNGNFLNAQAPNLTTGSLYYGMVPNNATGYDLIKLQNGTPLTTRFEVDALGNIKTAGDLYTGGTDRLTSAGELKNITGYDQTSGNFTIDQGAGDFASINKTLTSGGALSDVLTLTLDERGKPATANSDYSTLVLNRYDGSNDAAALKVNTGNAIFNGQTRLGNYTSNPSAIGAGSLIFNTGDSHVYVWTGSTWQQIGSGSSISFDSITSGTNTAATMVVGSGASLDYSGSGTINSSTLNGIADTSFLRSDTSDSFTSGTLTTNAGTTLNVAGTLQLAGTAVTSTATEINYLDGTTPTAGGIIYGNGTYLANSGAGSTGQVLLSGGTGSPTWSNIASLLTAGTDISITGTTNATINNTSTLDSVTGRGATTTNAVSVGDLTSTGTTTLGGITYTWPGSQTATYFLQDDGSGNLSWGDPTTLIASSIYWNQSSGAVYPKNNSVDLLVGSDATASAKFAFTGVDGGTPTASIAGTTANVATYLTGEGNLATTNQANLTLGGNDTGSVILNSDGNNALTATGANLTTVGTFTFPNTNTLTGVSNYLELSQGVSVGGGTTYNFDSGGNINATGITGTSITDSGLTASKVVFTDASKVLTSTGTVGADQGGTGFNSYTVGDILYADTATTLAKLNDVATGNVLKSGGVGAAPSWGQVVLGTDTTGNYVSTITGTANQITASASTGDVTLSIPSDFRAPGTVNAVSGLYTGAGAGTQRIDASGNLTNIGTTQLNGVTYTWPGADGSSGYALTTNGSGTLSWAAASGLGTNYWSLTNGAVYPQNNTIDFLVGGDSTSSATFSFTGVSSGTPTASISGSNADVATFIDGNGNISTTNRQNLTLGNSSTYNSTGNILLNPNGTGNVGIGVTSPAAKLSVADSTITTGNVINATSSAITSGNILNLAEGGNQSFTGNVIQADIDNTGGGDGAFTGNFLKFLTANTLKFKVDYTGNIATAGDLALNGGDLTSTSSTVNIFNANTTLNIGGATSAVNLGALGGTLTLGGNSTIYGGSNASGTLTLSSTSNATKGNLQFFSSSNYIDPSGNLTIAGNITVPGTTTFNGVPYTWPGTDAAASGYVLTSDGAGTLSWEAASGGGQWTLNATDGTLYPNSQTVDAFIGGDSTASAKFAFTGVDGGLPTASISGTTANVATYLTGEGNLATTNAADLTLGGTYTGNVILNSRGSTALTANGATLTTGGDLIINDTNTLQVGGSTGTAYNTFANSGESPVGAAAIAAITSDNDLFVGGDFQVAGTIYDGSGNVVAGYWTESGSNLYTTTLTDLTGIGTNSPLSKLSVVNDPASTGGTYTGKAAFLVDQYENQDILTASASGQTKLTLANDGTLKLYNATSSISNDSGDITIDAASNFISFAGDDIGNIGTVTAGTGILTSILQVANSTATTYSRFGADTTGHGLSAGDDVLISGDMELDGSFYLDSGTIDTSATTANIFASANTINLGSGSGSTGCTLDNTSGDLTCAGKIAAGGVGQFGGTTTAAYSRFGTATTGHAGNISNPNDLLIGGDLELDGTFFLDGGTLADSSGTGTILFPSNAVTSFHTLGAGSWLVDNTQNIGKAALVVNQTSTVNDLFDASSSGSLKFSIANNGDTSVGASGLGKLTAGTVDPPYTINGQKYATYMAGITGVKEETTGRLATNEYIPGKGYRSVIDFNSLPVGSDLWIFSKATDIKNNISSLVALLSPSDNTKTWYEVDSANKKMAIYSTEPTYVSYRLTAPRFDAADHLNTRTDNNTGFVLNIPDVVNTNQIATNIQTLSSFVLQNVSNGVYVLKDSSGTVVDGIESIGNFVAANIRVGMVDSQKVIAGSITAAQSTINNLTINNRLNASLISPIPGGTDVTVQIGSTATASGKLAITNAQNKEVASIDTQGNATFSGTVHSQNIDQIQALLNQVATDQSTLLAATDSASLTASGSANISNLIASDLYVTDQAAINSLSVTNTLTIGTDLVISSTSNQLENGNWQVENALNSLTTPLKIQSLAMAPVEIMAGLVKIDTQGNVQIAGNLAVAGRINSSGLTLQGNPIDQQGSDPFATDSAKLFEIKDATGSSTLASIDASGSAQFNSITTPQLVIAGADATQAGVINNGVITTNSTVGSAVIPAGTREITIKNPKINDYTLVYVTPTSPTDNYVLYVKSKENGQFVVGFDNPLNKNVSFNWWIVQVIQ